MLSINPVSPREAHQYRAIWRAIVLQMFVDATTSSKNTEAKRNKEVALEWFDLRSKDFRLTCEYADICPYTVMQSFERMIAENKRLRDYRAKKS